MNICHTIKIPFGNDPTTIKTLDLPKGSIRGHGLGDIQGVGIVHDGTIYIAVNYWDRNFPEKSETTSYSFRVFKDGEPIPGAWNYLTTVFHRGESWHVTVKDRDKSDNY